MRSHDQIEVIARGLLQVGSRYLLCRNVEHGYYYLPGGHVDPGETAAVAVRRELLEEAGLNVRTEGLLLAAEVLFEQGGRKRHEYNLVFHVEPGVGVELDGVTPVPSLEPEIAFDWVDQAALVEMDLRPDVVRAWLVSGEAFEGGGVRWIDGGVGLRPEG